MGTNTVDSLSCERRFMATIIAWWPLLERWAAQLICLHDELNAYDTKFPFICSVKTTPFIEKCRSKRECHLNCCCLRRYIKIQEQYSSSLINSFKVTPEIPSQPLHLRCTQIPPSLISRPTSETIDKYYININKQYPFWCLLIFFLTFYINNTMISNNKHIICIQIK